MMKKNSGIILTGLSVAMFMTATASANSFEDLAKAMARDAARSATIGILNNALNNNNTKNYRAPPGHKNLGPVNKRSAPAKQAPRPRNSAPTAVAKSAPKAAPVAVARVADPNVLEAQKNLAALGFTEVGTPDGFAGKGTASAVKAFEKSNGLPETGILSATVIALIAKDAAENTANPIESVTEVAEITKEEPKTSEIAVSEPVVEPAPVIEKAPEKAPETVPTAVASVAVPKTKTPEPAVIEEPAVISENEW